MFLINIIKILIWNYTIFIIYSLSSKKIIVTNMKVKVINKSKNALPKYETEHSAGMDVRADIETDVTIEPGEKTMIKTGLWPEIPVGYEIQVRPRSGLAFKKGITVLNSPGTIDSDYRGEIGIILINHGKENFKVEPGERIGQLVMAEHEKIEWEESEVLSETDRGEGGFGHTNTN